MQYAMERLVPSYSRFIAVVPYCVPVATNCVGINRYSSKITTLS